MDDTHQSFGTDSSTTQGQAPAKKDEVVSTHVLVPENEVERLRELSRKTRVAQSEYLREAVDDLLVKYGKPSSDPEAQK